MLYAAAGITTAHEGATVKASLETMQRAAAAGAHIIDVVAYPFVYDFDAILAANPVESWGKYKNRLKLGGGKITVDGSPPGEDRFLHHALPRRRAQRREELERRARLHPGGAGRFRPEALRSRLADQHPRQRRRGRRHDAARPRARRRLRPDEGPPCHGDPRPVHPRRPARQVRDLQDHAVVLHRAHLLLRRHAHPEPRRTAGRSF